MRILLLSAYDAGSHLHWRVTLEDSFPEYQWTVLSMPARYFNWRVRGNSLYWAFEKREILSQGYDLLVATSMVDLSALRGFVPQLCQCPTLVYFHENQFSYPSSKYQHPSVEPLVLNLYTALAADKVVFNSQYNKDTFMSGADRLLKKLPDYVPSTILARLESLSDIVPVPLNSSCFISPNTNYDIPLNVVWNHRWEYDKGPDRLLNALKNILSKQTEIHLSIIGQQFRKQPLEFNQIFNYLNTSYPNVLKHWGYVENVNEYRSIMASADVVLSTAIHDFQGVAVLEGVASNCIPLVPNRLCYKQWFHKSYLYDSFIDNPVKEAKSLASKLAQLIDQKKNHQLPLPPSVTRFCMGELKQEYIRIFTETIKQHGQRSPEPVL